MFRKRNNQKKAQQRMGERKERKRRRRRKTTPQKKSHRRRRRRRSRFVVPAVEEPRHDRPRVVLAQGFGGGLPPWFERQREREREREGGRGSEVKFPLKKPRPPKEGKVEKKKTFLDVPPAGTGSLSQRRAPAAFPEISARLRALPSSRAVFVCLFESLRVLSLSFLTRGRSKFEK